jgi:FtsP/CotA-like multicopper oxidase with cupredoxin domain
MCVWGDRCPPFNRPYAHVSRNAEIPINFHPFVILGDEFCRCTHVLQVNLGDVVEIVLIDEGYAYDVSHPFHLHGYSFYVVAMERHGATPSHIGASPGPGTLVQADLIKFDLTAIYL